jgi:hypothetical protein
MPFLSPAFNFVWKAQNLVLHIHVRSAANCWKGWEAQASGRQPRRRAMPIYYQHFYGTTTAIVKAELQFDIRAFVVLHQAR